MKHLFLPNAHLRHFASAADPFAQIWRLVLGLVLVMTFYLLLGSIFLAATAWIASAISSTAEGVVLNTAQQVSSLADSSMGTQILLASFGMLWVALWFVLRLVHGRRFSTLFGPDCRFNGHEFLLGLLLAAGFALVTVTLSIVLIGTPVMSLSVWDWLPFLVPTLLLLVLQIGAEELLFRGYIMQQLAARFRSPWIWAFMPSLIFGAVHYSPDTLGSLAWPVVFSATIAGLLFCAVTARTGNLAGAMGLHYGINISGLLIIGHPHHLGGMALFHWPADGAALSGMIAIDVLVLLLLFPVAAWVFGRRNARRMSAPANPGKSTPINA